MERNRSFGAGAAACILLCLPVLAMPQATAPNPVYPTGPNCGTFVTGDLNQDHKVDCLDLEILATCWLHWSPCVEQPVNGPDPNLHNEILRVPADYPTIQAAIDDANDGDIVLVAPGTYTGDGNRDIDFRGKAITVKSEAGPRTCIIDSQGSRAQNHRGFFFQREEGPDSILEGLTITGGFTKDGAAGIRCSRSSPQIRQCVITGNRARSAGAGIQLSTSDALVENCFVTGNQVVVPIWAGGGAGGIACGGESGRDAHPVLRNCTIVGNRSLTTGAGITGDFYGVVRLENCIITGNAVYGDGASFDPRGTQIAAGGCMSILPCMDVEIGNCAVEDTPNAVAVPAWHVSHRKTPPVADYIQVDPQFVDPGHWDPNGTPDNPYSDFWVEGDYHLKSQAGRWDPVNETWAKDEVTSPCIDAGDPHSPIGPEPVPNGGRINMGAYGGTAEASKSHFGGPVCGTSLYGDFNGDCRVDLKDFALLARNWTQGFPNPGEADRSPERPGGR
jgi:hypothetical protein